MMPQRQEFLPEATMKRRIGHRGAALPMVIIIITVMTVALAAAYTLNTTEIQIGDDYSEQVAALALAESGRNRYLIDRVALGWPNAAPGALEVDTIPYTGGQAIITLRRIRAQVQQLPPLYLLTSRGVRSVATHGGMPPAERTVSQYVFWDAMPLNVLAGWTSLTGVKKNGLNPGSLSGVDMNPGTGTCPTPLNAVSGVAAPTIPGPAFDGDAGNLTGTPPLKDLGTLAQGQAAVDIDWPGIVNNTAGLAYDIIIPGGAWPTAAQFADPNFWPTIRINGDYTLSTYGKGTLIVTGNLAMNSVNAKWDGVVLVGGIVTSNGNSGVYGATVTGLNTMLGMTVPISDVGNGAKTYYFNSCNATRALRQQAKLRPLPNTWMDNVASY
jgi:hypothetical protein